MPLLREETKTLAETPKDSVLSPLKPGGKIVRKAKPAVVVQSFVLDCKSRSSRESTTTIKIAIDLFPRSVISPIY